MRLLASAMLAAAGIGTAAGVGLVAHRPDPPAPPATAHPATSTPVAAPGGRPAAAVVVHRARGTPPKPHRKRHHDHGRHKGKHRPGR
jgi:hypothetical protein